MMTFKQVMQEMSGDDVFRFLCDPHMVDRHQLFLLCAWVRPQMTEKTQLGEVIIDSGMLDSISQVRQRIKDNSLKWNGLQIADHKEIAEFFEPGWGVVSLGKRNHTMIINNPDLIVEFT